MTHLRRRTARVRGAAVLLTAATLLAACGGDDDAEGDAPAATDAAASTAPDDEATTGSPATTATDESTPSTGGRLRFAYTVGAMGGFDPIRSIGGFAGISLYPAYDRLVHMDENGAAVPGLAESWTFADDGLSMEMKLRAGVVFHDGEPFDADAVKANLDRARTDELSIIKPEIELIESVEVVDDLTVRLHLSAPMASLPLVLSERPGMMVSPAAFDNEDLNLMPVGAGAYRVTSHDPDASITYERFEDYWNPERVRFDGIDFSVLVDATARLNALTNDELDLTYINAQDVPTAESAGLTVMSEPMLSFHQVALNRDIEPFDDVRVRRALNMAIDRAAIVEAVYGGVGEPSVQHFPEGYFAYNPDYPVDYFGNDPEAARQLLAEAGYPDGIDFVFTVMNVPYVVAYATAVQAQWAEAGIRTEMELVDPAAGAEKCLTNKGCEAYTVRLLAPDPAQTFKRSYTSDGVYSAGTDSTPELDAKLAEIEAAGDPDTRARLLREAEAIVIENALDVVIYLDATPLAYRAERLENVGYYKTGWLEFFDMAMVDGD